MSILIFSKVSPISSAINASKTYSKLKTFGKKCQHSLQFLFSTIIIIIIKDKLITGKKFK